MVPSKHQTGVALLTALFVVALATIAAVALVGTTARSIYRAEQLQDSEQAAWYAVAVESWVRSSLKGTARGAAPDSLGDAWAQPVGGLPVDKGQIGGQLEDLQGRFNLNNLGAIDPAPALATFQKLLESIPGVDPGAVASLGPSIRDWLDSDADTSPGGAEDAYYLALAVPYRTSGRLLQSPSELLAVKGMTPTLYEALRPYVSTLPTTMARINMNTAGAQVLAALGFLSTASFLAERIHDPLRNARDAVQRGLLPQGAATQMADVHSSYFLLRVDVQVDNFQEHFYRTIFRPQGNADPVVVFRSEADE